MIISITHGFGESASYYAIGQYVGRAKIAKIFEGQKQIADDRTITVYRAVDEAGKLLAEISAGHNQEIQYQ